MQKKVSKTVCELVRKNPSKFQSSINEISNAVLIDEAKQAKILQRFCDLWRESKEPENLVCIAWILSDSSIGHGNPALNSSLAKLLTEDVFPDDESLNREPLQEWISGVIFANELSRKRLEDALRALEDPGTVPETTGFEVTEAQIFFNGADLKIKSPTAREHFSKLHKNIGKVVNYKDLSEDYTPYDQGSLPREIGYIRKSLKDNKVPYGIETLTGEGYVLMPECTATNS